jgi:hypothetical protein
MLVGTGRGFIHSELDFGVTSINYEIGKPLAASQIIK